MDTLLTKDEELLFDLNLATVNAEFALGDVQNWIIGTLNQEEDVEEPNILELLSEWGKSSSILYYLKKQDEKDRARIFESVPEANYLEYQKRQATLEGSIEGIDKTDTELFETTINKQLMTRANEWREYVNTLKPQDLDNDLPDNVMTEVNDERDFLEYTLTGIHLVKARHPHFKSVDVNGFTKHVYETDKAFKQLLGKRRQLVYWADSTLWWRHKPQ